MPAESFYQNILENMADGVMALDFKGRIIMFNSAAGRILGLDPEQAMGKPFAMIFLDQAETNDQFNQVVLDAVYQQGIGLTSTVDFARPDSSTAILSITSSYLGREDGHQDKSGVILVFSDITEIKGLQKKQEEDARKLGRAYQDLEAKNELLQRALKKVQVVRVVSSILIICLFLGIGLYYFQGNTLVKRIQESSARTSSPGQAESTYHTVQPAPLSASVSLSGQLEPLEEIVVTAPFEAMITQRNFSFGQMVEQGDLLLALDPSGLEIKLRNARSDFIKANQHLQNLLNWDTGTEMTRARRSLARARDTLALNERKLEEAELLYQSGVIPAQELESARRQKESSQEDVQSALEELESVREKAGPENIELAQMDRENAKVNLENLERQLAGRNITAPVSGVVIQPVAADDKKISLEKGSMVNSGASLLAVGDLSGVTVSTRVDEIDVHKISLGQPVQARGDAFPGITLEGVVTHISAQAVSGSGRHGAEFDVRITFPQVEERVLDLIRVGMSADLEVVVYEKKDALLVPISFVRTFQGTPMVRMVGPDNSIAEQRVQTGMTTLRSVEVLSGVNPGDRLAGW
ncbi:efflux RND transporter periplasmic adaptor subunit [Desulfonatronovibrio hydrogenovorans]|uniref:efflux RND transporter periplasmic adaptor subunit n=1 Tax=Desulfonatronovibrio hydrogenovorans TaxID=53245 RepID=UPI00048FACD5|nr:HlyD family efflux transporter periplasmic adaptor subunit [Desulfonatronovibrio hydrogenovorans]